MLLFNLLASLLLLPTFSTDATGVANGLVVEKPRSWIPDEAAIGSRSINENQAKGNERRRGISVPKLGQDVEAVVPRSPVIPQILGSQRSGSGNNGRRPANSWPQNGPSRNGNPKKKKKKKEEEEEEEEDSQKQNENQKEDHDRGGGEGKKKDPNRDGEILAHTKAAKPAAAVRQQLLDPLHNWCIPWPLTCLHFRRG
jgi:hypothetical protein